MKLKVKNGLIRAFAYLLSGGGMAAIMVFQYFLDTNPPPKIVQFTIPFLMAFLIFFLVYYKKIRTKIDRKLQSIDVAKEIGKNAKTSGVVAILLDTIGVVIPLALMGGLFMLGGQYLVKTGLILFEILGMYSIIIIGNIVCDYNTRQENKRKELEVAEQLADKIAEKVGKVADKYE